MKQIFLFYFFIYITNILGQKNQEVETYTLKYNVTQNDKHSSSFLTFKNNVGVYYSFRDKEDAKNIYSEINTEKGVNHNIKINSKDTIYNIVKTNIISKEMLSTTNIFKDGQYQKYIVDEYCDNIQWKMINETKKIAGFNCKKAITRYKGRNYIVWYSEEIPTSIGPWKLHGLPGAILYATDTENYIQISIAMLNLRSHDYMINYIFGDNLKKISCEKSLSLKKEQGREIADKIQSKLPRGTQFNITNISNNWLEKDCN
jgi:GLPGLI family protein